MRQLGRSTCVRHIERITMLSEQNLWAITESPRRGLIDMFVYDILELANEHIRGNQESDEEESTAV